MWDVHTAYGTTTEHQRHEVIRRTASLRRLGIAYTITAHGVAPVQSSAVQMGEDQ